MNPIEALKMHGVGVGKKLVGDAQSADVRAGKTFSNAQGNDKVGTMPVRSLVAHTVTPGVNNIIKQAGVYDGDITIQGDPNLVAANIAQGKPIFGVVGTLTGKRFASGTVTNTGYGANVTVTGLSFRPHTVILYSQNTSNLFQSLAILKETAVIDSDANNTVGAFAIAYSQYGTDPVGKGIMTTNPMLANGFTWSNASFTFGTNRILEWEAYGD